MDNSEHPVGLPGQQMPPPQVIIVPSPVPPDNNKRNNVVSISSAIVIAAILIGGAIFASSAHKKNESPKSTIEALGIDKVRFSDCVNENRYQDKVQANVDSAARAMSHITDGFGTPYSIAYTRSGTMVEIPGALPYQDVRDIVNGLLTDRIQGSADIDLDPVTQNDHAIGDPKTAGVTIVEYSDLDCSFCARFQTTMKDIVKTYDGDVAWVFRHLPLDSIHPTARAKAEASECIAELGGEKAFWDYIDKLFELKRPTQETFDAEAF